MIRRRLFAYTTIFTAGISSGFFIFEKTRLASGTLLLIVLAVIICLYDLPEKDFTVTISDEKRRLLAFLAAGFLLFTLRFVWYSCMPFELICAGDEPAESEESDISGYVSSVNSIDGMARSVTVKDDKLRIVLTGTDSCKSGMKVLMTCKMNSGDLHPEMITGRRIKAYGTLRIPQSADNPGCFDYRIYLRSRGIGYIFSAQSIELDEDSNMSLYGRYLNTLCTYRERFLSRFDDPEIRGFIKGAVFGDKSDISEEVIEDFNGNGTGHILAVSGLHTGFLYALMRFVTGRRKSIGTAILIIAVLFAYGDMTMWSPSTMRAVTVLSLSIMSIYVRRPFDLLTSVSGAALLILIREPYQLFSTGFQMSFLALLGIAFITEPVSHFTGEALAVLLAVQAGTMPVTAFVFHRINILSVFINIPVIFLASLLVPLCMGALFVYILAGSLPGAVIMLAEGLTDIIIRINTLMSAGGIFSDLVTSAGAGVIVFIYLILFVCASEWMRVRLLRHEYRTAAAAIAGVLAVSLCFGFASFNRFADDGIVFVSVGQGDCTHIRAGGKDVLIDGGGNTERNVGKDVLMPYLLANGAERTEFALVTHLHTDHYLGIAELAQIYPVGAVGIPSDYQASIEREQKSNSKNQAKKRKERWLSENGQAHIENEQSGPDPESNLTVAEMLPDNIIFIEPDSVINITEDVYVEPVWPVNGTSGSIDLDDPNEHNMVYMIHYRGVKIMVTGDLLEEDELEMLDYYRHSPQGLSAIDCDILKVAHHGSKSSSSEAFLDAVTPQIAVIQVGLNNFYGHPHQQTLDRLEERGIKVYRTDLNGAVGIEIHGNKLLVDVLK